VAPAIAHVFGLRDAGNEPIIDRLHAYLRPKHLLLVLDNFEQVVEAAPLVISVLSGSPRVTVLVTSRVRLRVSGKHEQVVPPLTLAASEARTSLEAAARSEAVRLFVARAQAVDGEFDLTPENAHAIAEICRRVDGLPLAIELAAARIKILPPAALLVRLEQRLPVLTGAIETCRRASKPCAIRWPGPMICSQRKIRSCSAGCLCSLVASLWRRRKP
jgi:predicted ATPase